MTNANKITWIHWYIRVIRTPADEKSPDSSRDIIGDIGDIMGIFGPFAIATSPLYTVLFRLYSSIIDYIKL